MGQFRSKLARDDYIIDNATEEMQLQWLKRLDELRLEELQKSKEPITEESCECTGDNEYNRGMDYGAVIALNSLIDTINKFYEIYDKQNNRVHPYDLRTIVVDSLLEEIGDRHL